MTRLLSLLLVLLISACTGIPSNIQPVEHFKVGNYLGKWYEIARLDHSFERGLSNVTADYSLREDGGVRVINRGYSAQDQAWKEAEGKAYFVGPSDRGHLKVSFFGPFYGSYVVFELDHDNYQYSLVSGPSRNYMWLLSRTPTLPSDVKNRLIAKATEMGFDTGKLIFVEHNLRHAATPTTAPVAVTAAIDRRGKLVAR